MITFRCDRCADEHAQDDNSGELPAGWFGFTVTHDGEDTVTIFCSGACAGAALELLAPRIATHRCDDAPSEPVAATPDPPKKGN